MRKTILKRVLHSVFIVCMAMLLGCSGGSSSGGVYKQAFNVSGNWAGQIGDGDLLRNFTATLSGSESVLGSLVVSNHSCFAGVDISAGTATQAAENTGGDNPLTTDQENSNEGTLRLTFLFVEGDTEWSTFVTLSGNSSSLSGNYEGHWVAQTDDGGEDLKIPGDVSELETCKGGIRGSISMVKL